MKTLETLPMWYNGRLCTVKCTVSRIVIYHRDEKVASLPYPDATFQLSWAGKYPSHPVVRRRLANIVLPETFGQFLRRLRQEKGYNQSDFGRLIGLKQTYVSYLEKLTQPPGKRILARLKTVFGDNIDRYAKERDEWLALIKIKSSSNQAVMSG